MSYPVFPASVLFRMPGFKITPKYNTVAQTPSSGRGLVTMSLKPYPTWALEVDIITQGEFVSTSSPLAAFMGMFMQCNGGTGFFLLTVPNDFAVGANGGMLNVTAGAASPMSHTGDGVSTQFQLARTVGGIGWDVIQNLNGSPAQVTVNGTPTAAYSVNSTGLVTFTSAPANASVLAWTGNFYYLCRFIEDILGLERIAVNGSGGVWTCTTIKMESVLI